MPDTGAKGTQSTPKDLTGACGSYARQPAAPSVKPGCGPWARRLTGTRLRTAPAVGITTVICRSHEWIRTPGPTTASALSRRSVVAHRGVEPRLREGRTHVPRHPVKECEPPLCHRARGGGAEGASTRPPLTWNSEPKDPVSRDFRPLRMPAARFTVRGGSSGEAAWTTRAPGRPQWSVTCQNFRPTMPGLRYCRLTSACGCWPRSP
jgi:hypothetical protein